MISSLTAGSGLGELIALISPIPGTGNGDWSKAEPNDENDIPPPQSGAQLQEFVNRTFPNAQLTILITNFFPTTGSARCHSSLPPRTAGA